MAENSITLPQMRTIAEIASSFGLARHFVRQAGRTVYWYLKAEYESLPIEYRQETLSP